MVDSEAEKKCCCFRSNSICIREVVVEILLISLLGILRLATIFMPQFVREVQIADWHNHNYPFATPVRVSSKLLYLLSIVGYLLMVLSLSAVFTLSCYFPRLGRLCGYVPPPSDKPDGNRHGRSSIIRQLLREQIRLVFAVSLAVLSVNVTTNAVKHWQGRLRPDFLDRCKPPGFNRLEPKFDKLGFKPECTGTQHHVLDGRQSFPSGHASLSFSVYAFFGLYLHYYLLPPFGNYIGGWRPVLSVLVSVPAWYIAISRNMDYRHHVEDIIAGSMLGVIGAMASYFFYYPYGESISLKSCSKLPSVEEKDLDEVVTTATASSRHSDFSQSSTLRLPRTDNSPDLSPSETVDGLSMPTSSQRLIESIPQHQTAFDTRLWID